MELPQLAKQRVHEYFIEETCPFTKRSRFNMRTLKRTLLALAIIALCLLLYFGSDPAPDKKAFSGPNELAKKTPTPDNHSAAPPEGAHSVGFGDYATATAYKGGSANRSRGASQIVRRSGSDPSAQLPMGTNIAVSLASSIRTSDGGAPVVAVVKDDVMAGGTVAIPVSTRVIGQSAYHDGDDRIQVRFHTFVFPEGDQHPVQAIAQMLDGSSGLEGDNHSGEATRQIGRFLGNFIGGMALGMQDHGTTGTFGIPYVVGSVKNGVLNGISSSVQDSGRSYSESLSRTRAYMTLSAGQSFLLFLEQAFTP